MAAVPYIQKAGFLTQNAKNPVLWKNPAEDAILGKKVGGAKMKTKLTIGERLKDLRVERDMNQKDVENQAGIPTSTLSTYENDTVGNVNMAAIIKLAEFYEV